MFKKLVVTVTVAALAAHFAPAQVMFSNSYGTIYTGSGMPLPIVDGAPTQVWFNYLPIPRDFLSPAVPSPIAYALYSPFMLPAYFSPSVLLQQYAPRPATIVRYDMLGGMVYNAYGGPYYYVTYDPILGPLADPIYIAWMNASIDELLRQFQRFRPYFRSERDAVLWLTQALTLFRLFGAEMNYLLFRLNLNRWW